MAQWLGSTPDLAPVKDSDTLSLVAYHSFSSPRPNPGSQPALLGSTEKQQLLFPASMSWTGPNARPGTLPLPIAERTGTCYSSLQRAGLRTLGGQGNFVWTHGPLLSAIRSSPHPPALPASSRAPPLYAPCILRLPTASSLSHIWLSHGFTWKQ